MRLRSVIFTGALLCTAVAFWGCEWSGGSGSGFNTSRAGLTMNLSGVYTGTLSGGKAVAQTSGAPITRFVIQQTGNNLQVTDSNGQTYSGVNGAPGAIAGPDDVTIPAGVALAVFQLSWRGKDGVAAKDIEFTGVIDVVTVEDVVGETTDRNTSSSVTTTGTRDQNNGTTTDSTTGTTGDNSQTVTITSETGGDIITIIEVLPGVFVTNVVERPLTNSTQTITVGGSTAGNTGSAGDTSQNRNTTGTQSQDSTRSVTSQFSLTEANTQLRLRGTWIEQGGVVSGVEARSTGNGVLVGTIDFSDATDGSQQITIGQGG